MSNTTHPRLTRKQIERLSHQRIAREFLIMDDVLRDLLQEHEAWQVDWDRLNKESPDYDPEYKPTYTRVTKKARTALLLRGEGQPSKQTDAEAWEQAQFETYTDQHELGS